MPQVRKFDTFTRVVIALGGNLLSQAGTPEVTLNRAIDDLSIAGVTLRGVSPFFETPCFPAGSGPDYVNAVVDVSTNLPPPILLNHLHTIEYKFDRKRKNRWGSRTLDLDLLAYGDLVLPDFQTFNRWSNMEIAQQATRVPSELILPHPRMHERGFVLVPMARIVPDWRHPVLGKTVQEMLDDLPADALEGIREIETPD